jgi:hypothetical protein
MLHRDHTTKARSKSSFERLAQCRVCEQITACGTRGDRFRPSRLLVWYLNGRLEHYVTAMLRSEGPLRGCRAMWWNEEDRATQVALE